MRGSSVLQDLLGRGPRPTAECCASTMGRELRKALPDLPDDLAVAQRCVLLMERNVLAHLSHNHQSHVARSLSEDGPAIRPNSHASVWRA